jgi:hypothetical protein
MYRDLIRKTAPLHDPRLIEAWMRLKHSTLDGLSPARFKREVRIAADCVDADPVASKELAKSFGL